MYMGGWVTFLWVSGEKKQWVSGHEPSGWCSPFTDLACCSVNTEHCCSVPLLKRAKLLYLWKLGQNFFSTGVEFCHLSNPEEYLQKYIKFSDVHVCHRADCRNRGEFGASKPRHHRFILPKATRWGCKDTFVLSVMLWSHHVELELAFPTRRGCWCLSFFSLGADRGHLETYRWLSSHPVGIRPQAAVTVQLLLAEYYSLHQDLGRVKRLPFSLWISLLL